MKIFEIDLQQEKFYCPVTGQCLQAEEDFFADEVPSVMGYWIDGVVEEPEIMNENLKEAWEEYIENGGDVFELRNFFHDYEDASWVVFELTSYGIACGPVSSTIWYVIDLACQVPLVNILGYRVQLEAQRIDNFFSSGRNCLRARKEALELVKSLKETAQSFDGIKLSVEYSKTNNPDLTESHSILTGDRMHTEEILKALNQETEVLSSAMQEYSIMTTNMGDYKYNAVDQGFTFLYYFTAT